MTGFDCITCEGACLLQIRREQNDPFRRGNEMRTCDAEIERLGLEKAPGNEVVSAVAEALSNARENGFDFKGNTAEEIADDMMMCDADIEAMPRDHVVAAIKSIRGKMEA